MNDLLRQCYDIMLECGQKAPPFDEWAAHATDNAEVWPINRGAEMVGFVMFKGHTIHVSVRPAWQGRWVTKEMVRAWREDYPHACDLYATPDTDNLRARALAARLGFRLKTIVGNSAIYVKEAKCPQSH